jgi:hypothetical protein
MDRIEGPNWLLRHLISREQALRKLQDSVRPQESIEDPLAAAKRRYQKIYADDLGLTVQELKSDPDQVLVLESLDKSVETMTESAERGFDNGKRIAANITRRGNEQDFMNYVNRVASVQARGNERILELLAHWQASGDILQPKWKRILRKMNPFSKSEQRYEDLIEEVKVLLLKEMDELSEDWKSEFRKKL